MKNKSAQALGRQSAKKRFQGMNEKQRADYMRKLRAKRTEKQLLTKAQKLSPLFGKVSTALSNGFIDTPNY